MNYYAAPMEGLTDRIWRQAHQRWFGAPEAPVRYYAPFLSSHSCWQRTANLRPG